MRAFRYGPESIPYCLKRRARRTLEISVLPDQTVEVVAPPDAADEAIERRLRKRAGWIKHQLQYFDQFQPRTPERRYVSGETHLYLGRRYRLKVIRAFQLHVQLKGGYIEVHTHRPGRSNIVRQQLEEWYKHKAHEQFHKLLAQSLVRFPNTGEFEPVGLIIRHLNSRWGSMTPSGRLVLNRRLIQAGRHEIDYVITHELCHRRFHHHGPEFYKLLGRVMPDWERRKESLERRLI